MSGRSGCAGRPSESPASAVRELYSFYGWLRPCLGGNAQQAPPAISSWLQRIYGRLFRFCLFSTSLSSIRFHPFASSTTTHHDCSSKCSLCTSPQSIHYGFCYPKAGGSPSCSSTIRKTGSAGMHCSSSACCYFDYDSNRTPSEQLLLLVPERANRSSNGIQDNDG